MLMLRNQYTTLSTPVNTLTDEPVVAKGGSRAQVTTVEAMGAKTSFENTLWATEGYLGGCLGRAGDVCDNGGGSNAW
jgi:hypothetical protein